MTATSSISRLTSPPLQATLVILVRFSAGFIGNGAAGSGWNTITIDDIVPTFDAGGSPVDTVVAGIVFADNGFATGTNPNAGVSFYLDNICLEADRASEVTELAIVINSCAYDGENFTINYNTPFNNPGFSGVDIYYSTDLINWTADVFAPAFGENLEVIRPSADPKRFYILVQPLGKPGFGNFPDPPSEEYMPPSS